MLFNLFKSPCGLKHQKQNVTTEVSQSVTTSVSLSSLLSILPVWAIFPWGPHGAHSSRWSRSSRVPCRPRWAGQTAHQLGGVDGDVATSLGWGRHWIREDHWQQIHYHTRVKHDGHCEVRRRGRVIIYNNLFVLDLWINPNQIIQMLKYESCFS